MQCPALIDLSEGFRDLRNISHIIVPDNVAAGGVNGASGFDDSEIHPSVERLSRHTHGAEIDQRAGGIDLKAVIIRQGAELLKVRISR